MVAADQHEFTSAVEHGRNNKIRIVPGYSSAEKEAAFAYLRQLLREDRVRFSDPRLAKQLGSVMSKATAGGGLSIVLPRSRVGGHADLVSALVQAAWLDRRNGPMIAKCKSGGGLAGGRSLRQTLNDGLMAVGSAFNR